MIGQVNTRNQFKVTDFVFIKDLGEFGTITNALLNQDDLDVYVVELKNKKYATCFPEVLQLAGNA